MVINMTKNDDLEEYEEAIRRNRRTYNILIRDKSKKGLF